MRTAFWVSFLNSHKLNYLNNYFDIPQRKTATFRDPFCIRGSLSDQYPTTDTHTHTQFWIRSTAIKWLGPAVLMYKLEKKHIIKAGTVY